MENKNEQKIMIMSIQSYYARQIINGTKKFEFRKSALKPWDLNKTIYLYSAKEDKAIIGSFKVKKVYEGKCEEILKITGYDKRKDKQEIISYFSNTQKCYALELYDVKKFNKVLTLIDMRRLAPNINLPQYYAYYSNQLAICRQIKSLEQINN